MCREVEMETHPADALFLRLWTKATVTDGYVKAEWQELQRFVEAQCYGAGAGEEPGARFVGFVASSVDPVLRPTAWEETPQGRVYVMGRDEVDAAVRGWIEEALGQRLPALTKPEGDGGAT